MFRRKSSEEAQKTATGQMLTGRAARAFENVDLARSPGQLAWRELKKNRFAMTGLWLLCAMYFVALFGQFFASYDYQNYNPQGVNARYHPPMPIRFQDAQTGQIGLPFVYGTTYQDGEWLPDLKKKWPIRFFIQGAPYKLWGVIPMNARFIGCEAGPFFPLGTDELGRDYYSLLIFGAMVSLSIGFIGIIITFTLGLLIGGIAGFYGGKTDDWIMRGCEVMMSVPDFYLLIALAAALPADLNSVTKFTLITAILSFIGWAGMARVIRGMVLSVREREYVEAGRALGLSDLQIIKRHILPSTFTYAIIAATMSVPAFILAESGLSLLGLGIQPPMASWGNMLSAAQNISVLRLYPWIYLAPGLAISLTALAFNFLGDGLRDALDPKSKKLG